MSKLFKLGYKACYINDERSFQRVCEIPAATAVAWVKEVLPDTKLCCDVLAKDLTVDQDNNKSAIRNGWLNKLYILIAWQNDKWIAIYNHDGKFYIYSQ